MDGACCRRPYGRTSARTSMLVALLAGLAGASKTAVCEPHCSNACQELNGDDVSVECGACPASQGGCWPGADGFPAALAGDVGNDDGSGTDPAHSDGSGPNQSGVCADITEQRVHAALASVTALSEAAFWELMALEPPTCGDAADASQLESRGFAVVRQIVSDAALDAAVASMPRIVPGESDLFINADGQEERTSDGWLISEFPARFASRTYPRADLESSCPDVLRAMEALAEGWSQQGKLPPSQRFRAMKVGGYQYIRTDPTVHREGQRGQGHMAMLRQDGCRVPHEARLPTSGELTRCLGKWHMDPSGNCPRPPKLSLMAQRDASSGSDWEHGNIMFAPTRSLVALGDAATRMAEGHAPELAVSACNASDAGGQCRETAAGGQCKEARREAAQEREAAEERVARLRLAAWMSARRRVASVSSGGRRGERLRLSGRAARSGWNPGICCSSPEISTTGRRILTLDASRCKRRRGKGTSLRSLRREFEKATKTFSQ